MGNISHGWLLFSGILRDISCCMLQPGGGLKYESFTAVDAYIERSAC